jgi:lysozyme
MDIEKVKAILRQEEGLRLKAYKDTEQVWTIGYGHTFVVKKGDVCTPEQAEKWLDENVNLAKSDAIVFLGTMDAWEELSERRQMALTLMSYQLGLSSMRKFKRTKAAILTQDWQSVHDGILNSLWARQTPARANRVADMFLEGENT